MTDKSKKSRIVQPALHLPTMQQDDESTASLAAFLPDDRDGLLAIGAAAVDEFHNAILASNHTAMDAAGARYRAAIWKLNGGTFFASYHCANPEAAGRVMAEFCRATPGTVPKWGQSGEFVVTVKGIHSLVKFGNWRGSLDAGFFEFEVLDLGAPFISETGYRSHFARAIYGKTVKQMASEIFSQHLDGKRLRVRREEHERFLRRPMPAWLAALELRTSMNETTKKNPAIHSSEPPKGFVFVDVVLTEHQAFIFRKWAAAAEPRIKAAQKAEQESRSYAKEKNIALTEPLKVIELAGSAASFDEETVVGTGQIRHEAHEFYEGAKCVIGQNNFVALKNDIGKVVVVVSISVSSRQVFAHDDKPITYKLNRAGRKVVASDPRCIQTIYSMDHLQIIRSSPGEKNDHTK